MKNSAKIAVIGGSGLYELKGLKGARPITIKTPYGPHSGPIVIGRFADTDCAFLPRHGRGHVLTPSELNGRANIYALKSLGVERVIAVGAVGSLKEELAPRHFVFPDQLVDETKGRTSTFFGSGVVAHVAFADPFCTAMSDKLYQASRGLGIVSHRGGVYACMEGPMFSTRAESETRRKRGWSIIGMTAIPEAKLAREAELCYASVALVTDYDCWKKGEEVSSGKVIENLSANIANAQKLLERVLSPLAALKRDCSCGKALEGAIFTAPGSLNKKTARSLNWLIGRRIKQ